jgi:tetratricopeptide (TPR) repeat protein
MLDCSRRPRYSVCAAVALVFLMLSTSAPLSAQDGTEPAEYRSTIREALAEYHAKNFPEARALFAEAHRLMPNARTLRGLGMTAFELRSYRESIGFLEEALAAREKPLEGALRNETERLLKRAERFVGRLQLLLTPAETRVLLDGNLVERREGEALILEIGSHSLEFQAEGYAPETRTIQVNGRDNETWSVALTPLPPPPPPVVATPREAAEQAPEDAVALPSDDAATRSREPAERPLRKNPWLWTGVGAAVVIGVVTGVAVALSDPGVGSVREGRNTPVGGVFEGLENRP